jgi:O-antigen/teichoic acid export membrane protein
VLTGGLAFVTMFSVLTDLGLGNITAREIARDRSIAAAYIGNSLSIVAVATVVVVGLIVGLANLLHYPARNTRVIYMLCVLVAAGALTAYFAYVFLGLEKMYVTAAAQMLQTVLMVGGGLILAQGPARAERYALLYAAVSVSVAGFAAVMAVRYLGRLRPRFELRAWWCLLKSSLPVGVAVALVSLYYWNGHAMLQKVHGEAEVGVLNAAFRLVMGACFAGMALSSALYPLLSRFYVSDRDRLSGVVHSGLRYASMLVLPVVILALPLARPVVSLVYGAEFKASASVLRVLVWWGGTAVFSSLLSNYVLAANRASLLALQGLASLVVNVGLNLLLIPRWGATGAAVALVAAEATGLTLLVWFIRRAKLELGARAQGLFALRIIAALVPASLAAALLQRIGSTWGCMAALGGTAAVYAGMLLVAGAIRRDDAVFVLALLRRPRD